jgi:hypothetical protein
MAEQAPSLARHDLEAKIVKRCWENEEFRKEFTADPVGTAVKYLDVQASDLPKIVIHEEPAGSWHIVLPPKPANAGELSEQNLESIGGGVSLDLSFVVSAGASTLASMVGTLVSAAVSVRQGW